MPAAARAIALAVAIVGAGAGTAAAADPYATPFGATPAELRALVAKVPKDQDKAMLYSDQRFELDAAGRVTEHTRLIFYTRTRDAADTLSVIDETWDPVFEGKILVRARGVDSLGRVATLDPASVAYSHDAKPSEPATGPDNHVVAQLPVGVDTVVEEDVVTSLTTSPYTAGRRAEISVDSGQHSTFEVSAPQGLLHTPPIALGLHPPAPTHTIEKGRDLWRFDFGAVAPEADRDHPDPEGIPDDVHLHAAVALTTGGSWQDVARALAADNDRRIGTLRLALPAAIAAARPTLDTVRKAMAWINDTIPVEPFALHVPHPTVTDILARTPPGADVNDRAILMSAALRQLKVPHELVLVTSRPNTDLDPRLPGEDRVDRFLLRAHPVDGPADVWIDPALAFAPAGILDVDVRGRHALVLAPATTQLTTTPPLRAADQEIHEVRTYTLAETGAGKVSVRYWGTGVAQAYLRSWFDEKKDTDEYFTDQASDRFRGKYVGHKAILPPDLTARAELLSEFANVQRAWSYDDRIDVPLSNTAALVDVPVFMRAAQADVDAEPPRAIDYAWDQPKLVEIENRLILPPGYRAPELAPDATLALGPATLVTHRAYDAAARTISITYRFDPGKPRMTAAELAQLRAGLRALDTADREVISIPNLPITLSHAGKYAEAIAEAAKLRALHPREALHHTQLAEIYVGAGAIAAARREALAGTATETTGEAGADAQLALTWVLSFDDMGREYRAGWDRAGAIAAARKADQLYPSAAAKQELAKVLERDPAGYLRIGPQPDVLEAWRAAYARNADDEAIQRGLLAALARAHDPSLENVARDMPEADFRDVAVVTGIAQTRGASDAIAEAGQLRAAADDKRALLSQVFDVALATRDYALARQLYQAPNRLIGPDAMARLAVYRPASAKDPKGAVVHALAAMFDPARPAPVFDPELVVRLRASFASSALFDAVGREAVPQLVDAIAAADFKVEGKGPWRVTVAGAPALGPVIAYVAIDAKDGAAKVVTLADHPDLALAYLAGLPASSADARTVLDWLVADERWASPLHDLWGDGSPRDDATVDLVQALAGRRGARDLALLDKCASSRTGARLACDLALDTQLAKAHRYKELAAHGAVWAARGDRAHLGEMSHVVGTALAGKPDEADKLADAALAKFPDDHNLLSARAFVALARNQPAEAVRRFAWVRAAGMANELNNLAWLIVWANGDLADAEDLVERAVRMMPTDTHKLNTLAVVQVERGDLQGALQTTLRSIRFAGVRDDDDLYVLGRIAEQLGLASDARAIYGRIKKPAATTTDEGIPKSYQFVQRRLAAKH